MASIAGGRGAPWQRWGIKVAARIGPQGYWEGNAVWPEPEYACIIGGRYYPGPADTQHPEPGVIAYGLTPPAGSVPVCGGAI